ncbi:MAG: DUF1697 domain-containing protein [Gammaproteobacteria bacterium]
MTELVGILRKMRTRNVRTYIQSGNAIFQSERIDTQEVAGRITTAIDRRYGFAPRVILLTLAELKKAFAANPYPEAASQPQALHLVFLASVPRRPDLAALERLQSGSERFALKGSVFYLHAPEGVGKSKLFARIEKSLGPGTARNWRSVCNVQAIAEQIGREASKPAVQAGARRH